MLVIVAFRLDLPRMLDCCSPLAVCIAPSGPQGGGFQVSISISPTPMDKACGVFSKRVFLLQDVGQARATTIKNIYI